MNTLDYIQSTGTQWIDTGVKAASNLKFEIVFETSGSTNYQAVFGGRTGNKKFYFLNSVSTNYSQKELGFGGSIYKPNPTISTHNVKTTLVWDGTSCILTTAQGSFTQSGMSGSFSDGLNQYLFCFNDSGSAANIGNMKLYSCKIYSAGTLVRDFIPVEDDDSVPCLYDNVTQAYFYNQGTGEFVAGKLKYIEYIQSTGTQYINTGKTPTTNTKFVITLSDVVEGATEAAIFSSGTYAANTYLMTKDSSSQGNKLTWYYPSKQVISADYTSKHTVELYRGSITVDGTVVSSGTTISGTSFSAVTLFGVSSSRLSQYKLYGFQMYESDILVFDAVPALYGETACLYDKVSETFFYNAGSGSFVAGKPIHSGNAEITYSGDEELYIANETATYILEVWGAQGGNGNTFTGGLGGYSYGEIDLNAGDVLYVNVGGKGKTATYGNGVSGGYNGGGSAYANQNGAQYGAGGGASHIATKSGVLADLSSYQSDVLIVGGGGGGAGYYGSGGCDGADGGGLVGDDNKGYSTSVAWSYGGSQSAGGSGRRGSGGFGYGAIQSNSQGCGGGGGWYGGGADSYEWGGAGGSGYIGGVSNGTTTKGIRTGNGLIRITIKTTSTKYLIESGGDYYTISGGVLTNVGSALNAQLFTTYGLDSIPDWSDYSSLSNPSVLSWSNEDFIDMVATTTGLPNPQTVVSAGISLTPQGSDGIDNVAITDSGSPKYAFSVDGGTTYKVWSGSAWVASSGTDMSAADVEDLTKSEWDSLISGASFIKVRFTLSTASDAVESITITYAQA